MKTLNQRKLKQRGRALVGSLVLIVLGVVLWGGFNTAMEATNTLTFCVSCHEMRDNLYPDWQHSVHASNPSGVQAACPDCHVPKEWVPKLIRKVQASAEVYHWLKGSIDTPEKFEARRPALAQKVWETMQRTDSRECRNCHQFQNMDLAGQARFAARIHEEGLNSGKTCIDCHKGIAHRLPATVVSGEVEGKKPGKADLEDGEEINETCAACHGASGEGSVDGEYPRLAGLPANYLARQLRDFKSRKRLNIPMVPYTNERELPEADIFAVTAYLSSLQLPNKIKALDEAEIQASGFDALGRLHESRAVVNIPRYPGNVDAGKRFYRKECATCHGQAAEGKLDGSVPPLVGQRSEYVLRQITHFRKGERLHDSPKDAEIFGQFGDGEVGDLLAYLSILDD